MITETIPELYPHGSNRCRSISRMKWLLKPTEDQPACSRFCRSISRMKWLLKHQRRSIWMALFCRSISRMKWLLKLGRCAYSYQCFDVEVSVEWNDYWNSLPNSFKDPLTVEVSVEWNDYWNLCSFFFHLQLKSRSISRMKWLLKLLRNLYGSWNYCRSISRMKWLLKLQKSSYCQWATK